MTDGLLNAFSGSTTANPDTVALNVHWPPSTERWGIVEQITSTTFLKIAGRGAGVINGSVIDGTIQGGIGFGEDLRDDARHTGCKGPIRIQLTTLSGASRIAGQLELLSVGEMLTAGAVAPVVAWMDLGRCRLFSGARCRETAP